MKQQPSNNLIEDFGAPTLPFVVHKLSLTTDQTLQGGKHCTVAETHISIHTWVRRNQPEIFASYISQFQVAPLMLILIEKLHWKEETTVNFQDINHIIPCIGRI